MFYALATTTMKTTRAPRDLVVLACDVKCLLPVVEYARAGCHLLCVFHLPAYMGVAPHTPPRRKTPPYLGWEYGEEAVLRATETFVLPHAPTEQVHAFRTLLPECGGSLQQSLVRVCITLVSALFKAHAPPDARLFVRIGGVATLNAVSDRTVPNETFLYAQATLDYGRMLSLWPAASAARLLPYTLEPLAGGDACDAVRALVASTLRQSQRHVYADLSSGAMAFFPTDLCAICARRCCWVACERHRPAATAAAVASRARRRPPIARPPARKRYCAH
jgi:hypothetical protein